MKEEMKMNCPKCGNEVAEGSAFCTKCGASLAAGAQATNPNPNPNPQMGGYGNPNPQMGMPQQMYFDPKDHTAEFSAKDISDNKVMAMIPYLMGTIGIIIALLASKESAYTYFHVRQALKLTVTNVLLGIVTALLCWTIIVPIAAAVCYIILFVVRIICFFSVCSGKAKEPAIVSSFGFFK